MKIFAIRDESCDVKKDLAYLLYYEREKQFYIELPEDADPWETPLLLDNFVKRGETSVNSYWSRIWVEQRIVPTDRQNLGEILHDNGLTEYDEFQLLMLADGRCAQDDCYLVPLKQSDLPAEIIRRFSTLIEDVLPLGDFCLLVFFRDGVVKKCGLKTYFEEHKAFDILLRKPGLFSFAKMQSGGLGVSWDIDKSISASILYRIGEQIPLMLSDFETFVSQRVINANEASELLNCSRQNIMDLTKRGKLHPIKSSEKNTLYLKSEVLKRRWK